MTTETTEQRALAVAPAAAAGALDLGPRTFEQALTFSNYLADSDLVPKDFKGRPGNCLIAIQWGAELGLKPLQALQNLAIINGRPALWGDAVIALVRNSPACEWIIEEDDGTKATCRVKRRGEPEQARSFSVADAQAAGLAGKQGPWQQYPKRMRQMRARAFALRDVFPDVLRGLPVAEEVMDTPPAEKHMGQVDEVRAPAPPAAGRPALPGYADAAFDAKLPAWAELVTNENGRTASALLAKLSTKATFTEEQRARILSLKPAAPKAAPASDSATDSFVAAMEAAEAGNPGAK